MPGGRGGWTFPGVPNQWFGINRDSPQAKGLVAWWTSIGRGAGGWGLLHDVLGRYNMTTVNSPTVAGSEFGPGILFDDVSSQYIVNSAPVLISTPLTLAAWFNLNDTSHRHVLVSLCGSANDHEWSMRIDRASGTQSVQAVCWDGVGFGAASTTTNWSANTWHHGVAIFTHSISRTAYLDGGGVGTQTVTVSSPTVNTTSIGSVAISTPENYVSGRVAEARIYDRALSAREVAALYAPSTRWDLYAVPRRIWFVAPAAAVGNPWYAYAQQ
jgi:hypothetical protein